MSFKENEAFFSRAKVVPVPRPVTPPRTMPAREAV